MFGYIINFQTKRRKAHNFYEIEHSKAEVELDKSSRDDDDAIFLLHVHQRFIRVKI